MTKLTPNQQFVVDTCKRVGHYRKSWSKSFNRAVDQLERRGVLWRDHTAGVYKLT